MNPVNAYWMPPKEYYPQTFLPPLPRAKNVDFWVQLKYPDPVSGPQYYGENPIYGRQETINLSTAPEVTAIDNTVPASGGVLRFDPTDPVNMIKREMTQVKL